MVWWLRWLLEMEGLGLYGGDCVEKSYGALVVESA